MDREEIREFLNKHPAWTGVAGGVLILCSVVFVWGRLSGDHRGDSPAEMRVFYSTDDGQTYFEAASANPPPFMHEGKEAVRARVFSYDGGKTPKVFWLEKFTPRGRQMWEKAYGPDGDQKAKMALVGLPNEELVKKPGAPTWVGIGSPAYGQTIERVPDGNGSPPLEVFP